MRTGNPVKIWKRRIPQSILLQNHQLARGFLLGFTAKQPGTTTELRLLHFSNFASGDSSVEWRHFRASITEVARKFRSPNRKSDLRTSDKLVYLTRIYQNAPEEPKNTQELKSTSISAQILTQFHPKISRKIISSLNSPKN
nr:hypothetical protein Iba_chr01aCG5430 [Ipomoea batatas]